MTDFSKPICYMSEKQLSLIRDPDDDSGRYVPLRKTPAGNFTLALYAHQKTEWVSLTPEEIMSIFWATRSFTPQAFATAIDAKLREKNGM